LADLHVEVLGRFGRKTDLRGFIEAVVWVLRTGCPWRDLQSCFGRWSKVYRRFRRWAVAGRWKVLHQRLCESLPEISVLWIDSTAVRAHGHAAGAAGGQHHQALGRSRGGFGIKIHASVCEGGRLLSVTLTGAECGDVTQAQTLLSSAGVSGIAVIGDKAYDSDRFVRAIEQRGARAVIPSRKGRRCPRTLDCGLYRLRNVIERFVGRLKQFRRIATRYDKTAGSFAGFLFVAVSVMTQGGWC
jgi:transposase